MGNIPAPAAGAEASASTGRTPAEQRTRLREEFPGWLIEPPFAASRDARGGPLALSAGSYGELRALLDEADAIDCADAAAQLADALRARGAEAEVQGLSVSTKTRAGILRFVAARRGVFAWTSGIVLGPIGDVEAVADRMVRGLGLGARR